MNVVLYLLLAALGERLHLRALFSSLNQQVSFLPLCALFERLFPLSVGLYERQLASSELQGEIHNHFSYSHITPITCLPLYLSSTTSVFNPR